MSKLYNQLLQKYPIPTKITTSGFLFSLGDFFTQKYFSKQPFSWKRNIDFFFMGFGYIGPALHFWYCKLLPRLSAAIFPKSSKAVKVFGCMGLDQLVFAPFLLSGFFIVNEMVVNREISISTLAMGLKAQRLKLRQTMLTNWKIWPIATTINFWIVPLQYQVLFANFIGLFWNMILSYIATK